jgi:ABC-type transporter Mla MlaB component
MGRSQVGLFSIFKKKAGEDTAGDLPFRPMGEAEPTRTPRDLDAERARQREIARATAAKIDAIEYAMTFDIFNGPDTAFARGAVPPVTAAPSPVVASTPTPYAGNTLGGPSTLADDIETTLLLDEGAALAISPAIEESAILYANGQAGAAAQLLHAAVHGEGANDRPMWAMLFDLYQATGDQAGFERLAGDFASHFASSPPSWIAPRPTRPDRSKGPSATLAGALDAQCAATMDALLAQAPGQAVLQLDVSSVTGVDSDACKQLLDALERLRKLDIELVLGGVHQLTGAVDALARAGQRDGGPAPWLLLLALLQLSAQDETYEQVAMEYCVTFEESPPSYVAPPHVTIQGMAEELAAPARFALPAVLDHTVLDDIGAHAALSDAVEFDCSALARADYATATALLILLRPIQADGRDIAFHELNHLVAALFRLIGIDGVARLYTRKY